MSVDTEGHDLRVLESNDWNSFRPKILILETVEHKKDAGKKISHQFDGFMTAKGYFKLADTYINTLYVEKSYARKIHLDF
jgi:hypothetical protein